MFVVTSGGGAAFELGMLLARFDRLLLVLKVVVAAPYCFMLRLGCKHCWRSFLEVMAPAFEAKKRGRTKTVRWDVYTIAGSHTSETCLVLLLMYL